MATEIIKIDNGSLVVHRDKTYDDTSFELSLSDVDSISFERGGEANGASDGTLVLFTKTGERYTVRIADDEVGKYLKQIYEAQKPTPKTVSVKASDTK